MTLFTLSDETLDAPIRGSAALGDDATLRSALGDRATLVAFVRHLG